MTAESLFEKYYYSAPRFVDGTTEFHRLCDRHIRAGSAVLEIGAGPANPTSTHLGQRYDLTGLDVSGEVMGNPALRRARVYDGRLFPFEPGAFDACVSNYVLEHVEDPSRHFLEVARVLRPGGVYCFRTPNLLHYVAFFARVAPHAVHLKLANRLRGMAEDAREPWPTVYRANTAGKIRRHCGEAGLVAERLEMIEKEPSYGRSSPWLFFPMMLYERLANSGEVFSRFRANILGVVEKNGGFRVTRGTSGG